MKVPCSQPSLLAVAVSILQKHNSHHKQLLHDKRYHHQRLQLSNKTTAAATINVQPANSTSPSLWAAVATYHPRVSVHWQSPPSVPLTPYALTHNSNNHQYYCCQSANCYLRHESFLPYSSSKSDRIISHIGLKEYNDVLLIVYVSVLHPWIHLFVESFARHSCYTDFWNKPVFVTALIEL